MRLIDADALICAICQDQCEKQPDDCDNTCGCGFVGMVADAPTVKVEPPRLLTLDETLGGDECWIEGRNGACGYGDALLTDDAERVEFFRPHTISTLDFYAYGKDWRCWNTKPTDEQRKAVKWE